VGMCGELKGRTAKIALDELTGLEEVPDKTVIGVPANSLM
jgi:hypothetical protein